jgi:uncharacterized RDD family membrane protein YckC
MNSNYLQPFDTQRFIETPEGVDITLTVAGPMVRILAYSIDMLVRILFQTIFAILLALLGATGLGVMSIIFFLLEWFYSVYFEVRHQGQTPGKKMFGLQVINDDGTPINWSASILRNLLRIIDFLPAAYFIGIVSMILNRDFKRLGDLAAGTLVTYKSETPALPEFEKLAPKTSPIPLDLDEQRAVLAFCERKNELSAERQTELANILTPLLGKDDTEPVNSLCQIANSLVSNR